MKRKRIVLYRTADRKKISFDLMDVEQIQHYDYNQDLDGYPGYCIFLDNGKYYTCNYFEIEVVE